MSCNEMACERRETRRNGHIMHERESKERDKEGTRRERREKRLY